MDKSNQADPSWIDAHCHLPALTNSGALPEEIARAEAAHVVRMITVGTDAETSRDAIALAKAAGQRVRAVVGLHPHDAKNGLVEIEEILEQTIGKTDDPIVGIGEAGLDYYYDHSLRNIQREVFAHQIFLANTLNLPLIIHSRDSWEDTFDILQQIGIPNRCVLHCFSGGKSEAKKALDLGLHLSFSGIITFKNAENLREAARICPIEKMMIETDSPFLAPVPFRGKPNEPTKVGVIGEYISKLKEIELREFSWRISESTLKFFQLKSL